MLLKQNLLSIPFYILLLIFINGCVYFKHHHRHHRFHLKTKPYKDPLNHSQFPEYKKNGSKRDFALYLLKNYHPDGFYIIQRYEKMVRKYRIRRLGNFGRKGFMVWARGKGKESVLNSIGTMVHESNHSYTSLYPRRYFRILRKGRPWGFRGYGYYLNKEKSIIVQFNRIFPSRKIHDLFPKSFMKKRMLHFRYDTYVFPSSRSQSTQIHGIFGLLDEFNSYYHGCRAHLNMLPYYKKLKNINPQDLAKYFSNVNGTRYAFYEFKLFILLYMMKARTAYPLIYKNILNNKPFLKAFLTIEKNYSALLTEYQQIKNNIKIWVKTRGFKFKEYSSSIFIWDPRKGSTRTGYGHFNGVIAAYEKELAKPRYLSMMAVLRQHLLKKNPENRAKKK